MADTADADCSLATGETQFFCTNIVKNKTCGADLVQFGKKLNYCSYCGWKVDWVALSQSSEQSQVCGGKKDDGSPCKNPIILTDNFCSKCGTKVKSKYNVSFLRISMTKAALPANTTSQFLAP